MPEERIVPTTKPATVVTPVILIDGNAIDQTIQVDSITVRKEINRVPQARVVILDGEASSEKFQVSNGDLFIPGKEIEIKCGYQGDLFTLFKGIITGHSIKIRSGGSSLLVAECRDKAVKMTIGRHSRYFLNMKDSDIISDISGAYPGIRVTTEATGVTHNEMVQYDVTDWDFMIARAEVNGQLCIADDGVLEIKPPALSQSPVLSLIYGATVLDLDAEIDARHQLQQVTAKGWNYSDQEVVATQGADQGVTLNGNLASSTLAEVSSPGEYLLRHGGNLKEQELQAWSDALVLKRELARVRGRVRCKGIHTVKPGTLIELGGVGDRFNGNAFVSGIQHFIATGDWQTDIQFGGDPEWFTGKTDIQPEPAGGLLAAIHGVQTGVVTQIEDDPESENRIQVRLPIINEGEPGIWARLASPDAGSERGFFCLPEVGDEVVVAFINGDPRQAVVLGMLNSSSHPAPLTAQSNNPEKGFVTRSKMKMIFDDDKKSFTLETPAGKKIIVDEQAGEITVSDENQNKLLMSSSGITLSGQTIEIKATNELKLSAANLSVAAQATLKLEGSASAEVKAGGNLVLKGGIVQIN